MVIGTVHHCSYKTEHYLWDIYEGKFIPPLKKTNKQKKRNSLQGSQVDRVQ